MYDFSYFVCLGNWHRLITFIISFCARYYYCYFFVSNKLSLSAVTLAGKKKIQKERERGRERDTHVLLPQYQIVYFLVDFCKLVRSNLLATALIIWDFLIPSFFATITYPDLTNDLRGNLASLFIS